MSKLVNHIVMIVIKTVKIIGLIIQVNLNIEENFIYLVRSEIHTTGLRP